MRAPGVQERRVKRWDANATRTIGRLIHCNGYNGYNGCDGYNGRLIRAEGSSKGNARIRGRRELHDSESDGDNREGRRSH